VQFGINYKKRSYMAGDKIPCGGIKWIGDWMRTLTNRVKIAKFRVDLWIEIEC
jgi:hypothetical protein